MLKRLLPNNVKISFIIDDIRLKSKLNINQTSIFTKKISFYTVLGSVKSYPAVLGDVGGFFKKIPGSYKSNEPNNIRGIDKSDCINGSVIKGTREPFSYSFALGPRSGHKLFKELRIKLLKKKEINLFCFISGSSLKMMIINQLILIEK